MTASCDVVGLALASLRIKVDNNVNKERRRDVRVERDVQYNIKIGRWVAW